ncbi:MAG TPA: FAD-dependent monooxygenase, partial [Thermomicrobiales bacterium]|nr:FAD-dependent monooxygenase [Thermomicrobiales bacterium]
MKCDAVIVGARCAGAATALLLARAGARVLMVDKGVYGSDTLSTHALMRGAVLQLHRWNVLPTIVAAGTPHVHSTTFSYREHDISVPIEPRFGVSALYAPRRALLDRVLVDAATGSGAEVRYGVRVEDLIVDDRGRIRGITAVAGGTRQRIDADIVIGADGLYSTIAQRVGAPRVVEGRHSAGVLYSYWHGVPVDGYYWKFQTGASIGAIPTNDGATCVFVSVSAERFRSEINGDAATAYRRLIREVSTEYDARLDGAYRVEPVRGFGGQTGFIKRGAGPGWALVGDAGYFKDPLTAHGITDALRDAELLARAIVRDTAAAFADYEATRVDLSRRLFEVTDEIASFAWTDSEVQLLHRAFSSEMSREV